MKNLKDFGIFRIFYSLDFILSLAVAVICWYASAKYQIKIIVDYTLIINVLVGLFAFVFAALAIVISLSDEKFVKFLKKQEVFHSLLFHYWFACDIYLASIFIIFILNTTEVNNYRLFALFLISYSLLMTIELVKTTISFGLYREEFIENNIKN